MSRQVVAWVMGVAAVALVAAGVHASTVDVTLPADYRQTLVNFTTVDRADNGQVRVLYGSQAALDAVKAGQPAPSGSVMVMEIYPALKDLQNQVVRGADGRLQRGALAQIFVMEKRTGWGAQYPEAVRNGDWDYAVFTPAGQRTDARDMQACMTCHLPKASNDFLQLPAGFVPAR